MSGAIRRKDGAYTETTIDDECVVMNLDSGDFYSLTGTGRAIWELIDGVRDRAALLDALAADFATTPDTIAADLDAFLAQLAASGLLIGHG